MIRQRFMEDPDGGFPAVKSKDLFTQTMAKLEKFESAKGKTIEEGYTREEYVELFNSMQVRHTSTFWNRKAQILYYVRYLIQNNVLEGDQEGILESITFTDLHISNSVDVVTYHKDVYALREAITSTVSAAKSQFGNDPDSYDVPIAALYLAWYGLTEYEALNTMKSDVYEHGVIVEGDKIHMEDFVVYHLVKLRDAAGYTKVGNVVLYCKYYPSVYLLRSIVSSKMTVNALRTSLSAMNKIEDSRRALSYGAVWRSGVFYRAYQLEKSGVIFNKKDRTQIAEVLRVSMGQPAQRHMLRDYEIYKQLYQSD